MEDFVALWRTRPCRAPVIIETCGTPRVFSPPGKRIQEHCRKKLPRGLMVWRLTLDQ